jgi:multidrug efflux system outer membrane protein
MRRLGSLLALPALLACAGTAAGQDALRLSLEEAVNRAAAKAPDVRLGGLRVEESEARVQQARAALLPTLDAGSGWTNRTFSPASMGLDTRLHVSQPLFAPAARTAVRAARRQVEASEAERDAVAEAAAARAARAYVDAVRARSVLAARAVNLELARELVRLAREQDRAGTATPLDVTRAETEQLAAEGDSLAAAHAAAQADIELARVLGLDPATRFQLPDALEAVASSDPLVDAEAGIRRARASRPELRVEQARLEAVQAAAEAVRAERLPRVDLLGDFGWDRSYAGKMVPTHQVGVRVSIPLLDGLGREGRIAEQRILAEQTRVRERDLSARVEGDVRMALLDVAAAGDQRRVAQARVRLALRELEQAQALYREGLSDRAEVVDARRALVTARDTTIAAEYVAAAGRIRLAQATGRARALR